MTEFDFANIPQHGNPARKTQLSKRLEKHAEVEQVKHYDEWQRDITCSHTTQEVVGNTHLSAREAVASLITDLRHGDVLVRLQDATPFVDWELDSKHTEANLHSIICPSLSS
eukprot:4362642-Pyramimonas_sp.AAC.1